MYQQIEVQQPSDTAPEFGRVSDVQRLFGIKKGVLYRWINEGRIHSACIREPGNFKGIRLICIESVRNYIRSQMKVEKD